MRTHTYTFVHICLCDTHAHMHTPHIPPNQTSLGLGAAAKLMHASVARGLGGYENTYIAFGYELRRAVSTCPRYPFLLLFYIRYHNMFDIDFLGVRHSPRLAKCENSYGKRDKISDSHGQVKRLSHCAGSWDIGAAFRATGYQFNIIAYKAPFAELWSCTCVRF